MLVFCNRTFCTVFVVMLLLFTSVSVFGEELIIKFSSSIDDDKSQAFLAEYDLELVEKIESLNLCTVNAPSYNDIELLINVLESDSRIEYVEKNMASGREAFLPNDVFFVDQWHHDIIGSESAWDITRGSSDVLVAVIDSGLQLGNPDLSGARFLTGFDFVNNDNDTDDDRGHGTSVTGMIAANANNGIGGAGIDHNATILPVKVLDSNGNGTVFDLVQGINYAITQGADVINMSLGYSNAISLNEVLLDAREANIISVAASGNDGVGHADIAYPSASPHTISVGATDDNNIRAFFSGNGEALDVVAPGSGVFTTGFGHDGLDLFSGTSAASPIVAAVASLAKSIDPTLNHDRFKELIRLSSRDQVGFARSDPLGRDVNYGWGLIDAPALLERVNPGHPAVPARIEAEAFNANFDTTSGDRGDSVCDTGDTDSQATSDLDGVCNIGWTAAGEWLEYKIFVEQTGRYDVNLRLASNSSGLVSMEVDGVEVGQVSASTGNWQSFEDYIIPAELSHGVHTVRVNFINGGVNFNFLDVQLVGFNVPARIEAENFLTSFDTTLGDRGDDVCDTQDVDSQFTSDSDGLCNIGWTASGEWLEYGIFVDQPGTYFINLRLASRSSGLVAVDVDGTHLEDISVSTGGWQDYSDYIIWTQLDAGAHTIRVNFVNGNVNFNFLDIRDSADLTINTLKDAYIRGGSFADDNFGQASNLIVKSNSDNQFAREAYLQFGIGGFTGLNVQSATVRLYANRIDDSMDIALHRITANNVAESDITWNNTPDEGAEVAVTSIFSSQEDFYYEWDVTDYLKEKIGFNTFNLLIKERNNIDEFAYFNSNESGDNPPELVITFGN